MTPEEERNLGRLELAITRLADLVKNQRSIILKQREENMLLWKRYKELENRLDEAQDKHQTLLMARMIVANDKDWQKAYSRLSVLQREIQEAIKLLELE